MKITIDSTNKTIQIEQEVIIDELLKELESLNIDYTEYKLIPQYAPFSPLSIPIGIPNYPWDPYGNGTKIWYTTSTLNF